MSIQTRNGASATVLELNGRLIAPNDIYLIAEVADILLTPGVQKMAIDNTHHALGADLLGKASISAQLGLP